MIKKSGITVTQIIQATNERGDKMKNTKIINKYFILGAALLTAVLIFGSCKNDTTNINDIP